jgi:hypothetical protein
MPSLETRVYNEPRPGPASILDLAMTHVAMHDAIQAIEGRFQTYSGLLPATSGGLRRAVREGHLDGNPATVGDTTWVPHTGTPNYPDYTSGANNLTGAVTGTLEHFFGTDEMTFLLRGATGTRPYSRFSDVADDVCEARILEGIHFRFADSVARTQGRAVAKNAFKNFLRPVNDDE